MADRPIFVQPFDGTNYATVTAGGALNVALSGGTGTGTSNQGTAAALASAWPVKLTNGTTAAAVDTNGGVRVTSLPGTPITAASASAAAANNVTLTGAASKTTYITGFTVSGLGATGAAAIAITVTGLAGGNTLTYYYTVPAGATAAAPTFQQSFAPPLPASAANTAIVVNVPSFGAGNNATAVVATGFQL